VADWSIARQFNTAVGLDVIYAYGSVWFTSPAGATDRIYRHDPITGSLVADWTVNDPTSIHAAFGSVWIAETSSGTVYRIDPDTNTMSAAITGSSGPTCLTDDGSYLWIGCDVASKVERVDIGSETIDTTITTGFGNLAITYLDGHVYTTNRPSGSSTVTKISTTTLSVAATITTSATSFPQYTITNDGEYVWVGTYIDNKMRRIDPATNTITADVTISAPIRSAYRNGLVIANGDTNVVIDTSSATAIETIPKTTSGLHATGMAYTDDGIWFINSSPIDFELRLVERSFTPGPRGLGGWGVGETKDEQW
jgi:DNA-binding beta-propeller fold protein YncE